MTIDGNKLMMLLNDWWYSSFGYDEETEDSKAIKTVMDKIEKNLKDLILESCEDAISRTDAVRVASGYCHPSNIAKELAKLPPVTPIRLKGHWIEIAQYSDGKHKIECSECKSYILDRGHANSFNVKNKYKYCPNCGSVMNEVEG